MIYVIQEKTNILFTESGILPDLKVQILWSFFQKSGNQAKVFLKIMAILLCLDLQCNININMCMATMWCYLSLTD